MSRLEQGMEWNQLCGVGERGSSSDIEDGEGERERKGRRKKDVPRTKLEFTKGSFVDDTNGEYSH